MIAPFDALKSEYTALISRMVLTRDMDAEAHKLIKLIDAGHYDAGCMATGVPKIVAATSFEREASSNFGCPRRRATRGTKCPCMCPQDEVHFLTGRRRRSTPIS